MDILFYDDQIIETESVVIPHPRLHQRAFVLVPLNDIAPDLVHPVLDKPVSELLLDVDRMEIVEYKGK
ncbi:MAG TPA: 2-amino-4-hydroxy-6-hydroxymethyldihydropteridine diphosphokinase, partial [Anaerolineales bacterium]|nr:2-amino-4-hydroxy-6-hydroxymethyldihydropteridine diphosphokinase [Anaerolineales bacterium]